MISCCLAQRSTHILIMDPYRSTVIAGESAFWPPAGLAVPFAVTRGSPETMTITMQRSASDDATLSKASAYTWIRGFTGSVTIDFGRLVTLNSMICSWIIALQHEVTDRRITLLNCSPRVIGILKALHLNEIVDIAG